MLKMEDIINQIHDAVIVTDLGSNIIEWNRGAEKQLGYTKSEVLGRPVYFLYPDTENTNFSQQQLLSILAKNGTLQFEATMRKKSGEQITVNTSLSPYLDDSNQVTGIISYTLDITRQKQNEAMLRQQALLIDQIHDAVIVTDLHGNIIQWNRGARNQLGYEANEVLGRPVYFLYPETREKTGQDEMVGLLCKHGTITFEAPMQKKTGETILVHTSLSPVSDPHGKITGVISYTLDISEQRKAEQVRREKERIEHDLEIANQIQKSLLPAEQLVTEKYQVAGMNQAADHTGGDYYDWLPLPGGKTAITIADVTGHGIGPALIVAVCRAYFRASTRHQDDLRQIISSVNQLLTSDLTAGRFVTAAIGVLDMVQDRMEYYSAGHAPTYFYNTTDNTVELWGANDPPLGIIPDEGVSQARLIDFSAGDCLVLVTDGIYEWTNASGSRFGMERLQDLIREIHHLDAMEMIEAMYAKVLEFSGGEKQLDDVTVVVIKRIQK